MGNDKKKISKFSKNGSIKKFNKVKNIDFSNLKSLK